MARLVFLAVALTVAIAGGWWVTAGSWQFTEPMGFADVFDGQAKAFLSGRLDLDCVAASGEAFVVGGKCYVYFGPVPALLRLPLFWAVPSSRSVQWSRTMVWLANLLLLAMLVLILDSAGHRVGSWTSTAWLLACAFATTVPYMWGWPTAYVEALSWAVAFAAASVYCLLEWCRTGSVRWMAVACACGLASFFARSNTGAGPLTAVGLLALTRCRRETWARRVLATLTLFAALFFSHNHARFGTVNPLPMRYHIQYDAARLAPIGGTLFHPTQFPGILVDYLVHLPRFRSTYPFLEFRPGALFDLGPMDMPHHHVHAGALPLLALFAWLAWGGWRRRAAGDGPLRLILAAGVPSVVLLSAVVAMTHRYQHEFLILFLPAAAFGVTWAWETRRRRAVTLALALWGLYANWAMALVGQREVQPWTSQAALDRHAETRFRVDRALGLVNLPLEYDNLGAGALPPRLEGVTVRLSRSGAVYRFTGSEWRLESGEPPQVYRLHVDGARVTPGQKITVLVSETPKVADIVTVERTAPERFRVCLSDWASRDAPCGNDFPAAAGALQLRCELDRLNMRMRVIREEPSGGASEAAFRRAEPYIWPLTVRAAGPAAMIR